MNEKELVNSEVVISPRQIDVLRLVCDGLTNAQIGHELGITEDTVKVHVVKLLENTGAQTRGELSVFAFQNHNNLINIPEIDPKVITHLRSSSRKVLYAMRQGGSDQAIADSLGLGIETIKSHLKYLYGNTGLNRIQLVILANTLPDLDPTEEIRLKQESQTWQVRDNLRTIFYRKVGKLAELREMQEDKEQLEEEIRLWQEDEAIYLQQEEAVLEAKKAELASSEEEGELLSEIEALALQHLALGFSDVQIAKALNIKNSNFIATIMDKLNVESRIEAALLGWVLYQEELVSRLYIDANLYDNLSIRERNILIKLSKGILQGEIAESFRTSPGSMRMEISGIYRKIGIVNRLQTGIFMFEVDRARAAALEN